MPAGKPKPLARVRKFCLALPEAHEVEAWGEPTFRVRNKIFAMYANGDNHHGAGRHSVWCKSTHVTQDLLVHTHPDQFFVPPYVGPSGWVGIWLDDVADWNGLTELLEHSYRLIAPKRLLTQLENPTSGAPPTKRRQVRKSRKPLRSSPRPPRLRASKSSKANAHKRRNERRNRA